VWRKFVAIGDVLAVVAAIFAICGSAWALLVISSVIFGNRTRHAQTAIESRPWRCLGIGVSIVAVFGFMAVVLAAQPNPAFKLFGTTIYLAIFGIAVVGGGGLATLIARKMLPLDSALTPFQALTRGSGILVLAGLFPMLGWFVVGPLSLLISVGAGVHARLARAEAPPVMPEVM
jgi:hypothetical protein